VFYVHCHSLSPGHKFSDLRNQHADSERFYVTVSFKLTVTVTEISNNLNKMNQVTVTVTEVKK